MECKQCRQQYDETLAACPYCGAQNDQPVAQQAQPMQGQPQPMQNQQQQYSQPVQDNAQQPYAQPNAQQPYGQPQQNGQYGQQQYGQPPVDNSGKGLAIGGLVCGIIGIVTFWVPILPVVMGIIAIILGSMGKKRLPADQAGLATAGFVCGIIALIIGIIFLIIWIVMFAMVGMMVSTGLNYYDWMYDPMYF